MSVDDRRLSRAQRTELLAAADAAELIDLADRCLEDAPPPQVTKSPELGLVALCVREPVVGERFVVADVLATQAEVDHRNQRGWAMRLGDEPAATLAAAICDAEAESGQGLAEAVEALCRSTQDRLADAEMREWAELAPTEVHFEELA